MMTNDDIDLGLQLFFGLGLVAPVLVAGAVPAQAAGQPAQSEEAGEEIFQSGLVLCQHRLQGCLHSPSGLEENFLFLAWCQSPQRDGAGAPDL